MSLRSSVTSLNEMILNGQVLDAFEKFYADDVDMVELDGTVRSGKAANRAAEEAFVNGLTEFRGAKVLNVAVNEKTGVAFVEWFFDYSHRDWGDRAYHQVAVQQWKDGQIVREKFYGG